MFINETSKFYEFKNDKSQSVEKVSQDVLKLIEDQNLSETEKGEVDQHGKLRLRLRLARPDEGADCGRVPGRDDRTGQG